MSITAQSFIEIVSTNIDNPKLTDQQFREFIRNTLPIVDTKSVRSEDVRTSGEGQFGGW